MDEIEFTIPNSNFFCLLPLSVADDVMSVGAAEGWELIFAQPVTGWRFFRQQKKPLNIENILKSLPRKEHLKSKIGWCLTIWKQFISIINVALIVSKHLNDIPWSSNISI